MLDNPVWHALTTRHAHLAEGTGAVRRYRTDVSVFWAIERNEAGAWAEVAALAGSGDAVVLIGPKGDSAPDWPVAWQLDGYQMVLDELVGAPVPADVRRLGVADVDAMLDLVARTRPGPFRRGTISMGEYHGVVRDDRLLAMAGQRLHLDGEGTTFHEISAIATDAEAQGQGLAAGLSTMVLQAMLDADEVPFLHVVGTNATAIRVYERLGFEVRTPYVFTAYEVPA